MTDAEQIDLLFREYHGMVRSVALARCKNHHDADDISQEVWITVSRKFHELKDKDKVRSWLASVSVRHAINYMKLKTYKKLRENNWRPISQSLPEDLDVERFLVRLEKNDSDLLIKYYWEQKTINEISKEIGRPSGTIKRLLFNARNKLKEVIVEEDADPRSVLA
jgi:RNA polymerase sigma-70 factor, ECF subfamily